MESSVLLSLSASCVLKWFEGFKLQNLSLSGPFINSKWTSFTVYINTYSEKYMSTSLLYITNI